MVHRAWGSRGLLAIGFAMRQVGEPWKPRPSTRWGWFAPHRGFIRLADFGGRGAVAGILLVATLSARNGGGRGADRGCLHARRDIKAAARPHKGGCI